MRFKEVKELFYNKYPNGKIWKESVYNKQNTFEVSYNGKKIYTYRVCNLTELCYKLKLKERPIMKEEVKTLEELNDNEFGLVFE